MTTSLLKKKLQFKGMKDQVESAKEQTGTPKDPRNLEYFNLKDGESMKILLVPDVNGSLFLKYETHGGRKLKLQRGTPNTPNIVTCPRSIGGGDCEICDQMMGLYKQVKDEGLAKDSYEKVTANRLQRTETVIFSCLVLESPVDIDYPADGNQVKLFRAPKDVFERIFADIEQEEVTEDNISEIPFVIRKTKGDGEYSTYKTSGFSRKTVSEDELAFFEDKVVDLHDYTNVDNRVMPEVIFGTEEQLEWVEMAKTAMEASDNAKPDSGKGKGKTDMSSKLNEKLGRGTSNTEDNMDDPEDNQPEPEQQQSEPQREMSPSASANKLASKLAGLKK